MQETPSISSGRRGIASSVASTRWAMVVILTFAIVLTVRLGVTAWQLRTAPGVLSAMFREATLGWLGWGHEQINSALGSRQADFWVAEADRILGEESVSETARGLAWMLDSPGTGFYVRYMQSTGLAMRPVDVDSRHIANEMQGFEARAAQKCLDVAELPTRLAPDDVQAWRTRALLLFRNPLDEIEKRPRADNWQAVLAEARTHDPDNAIYDYLEAQELWNESTSYDHSNQDDPLIVRDGERFAESGRLFEQALRSKLHLASDGDWQAIIRTLALSNVPLYEHPELINSRFLIARETGLETRLLRMAVDRATKESAAEKLRMLRNCLRLAEQIGDSSDLTRIDTSRTISDIAAAQISDLLSNHRDELPAPEVTRGENEVREVHLRNLIRVTAASHFLQSSSQPPQAFAPILRAMLMGWLASTTVLLTAIALVALWILRLLPSNVGTHHLGIVRHIACWLVGFTVSFVLLGLAPAEVISFPIQQSCTRLLIAIAPLVVVGSLILMWLRRRNWRFTLLELLVATPIAAGLLLLSVLSLAKVFEPGAGYHIQARLREGVNPVALQAGVPMFRAGSFAWTVIQWSAYSGATVAVLLALSCVAIWTWRRSRADRHDLEDKRTGNLPTTIAAIRASAASAAVLALLAFLACAPSALRDFQSRYDAQMAWYFEMEDRRDAFAARIKAIESDSAKMKELREQAEKKSGLTG